MVITRRTALRNLGLVSAGLILLPGCVRNAKPATIALKNLKITGDQEEIVASLVDTIMPKGELPGARELNVQEFVLKMVDDCQSPDNRTRFVNGMAMLDADSEKEFGKIFLDLTAEQRLALLEKIELSRKEIEIKAKADNKSGKEEKPKETPPDQKTRENALIPFIGMTKNYTIQGYLQSEYVMTNVLKYNMIPGRFDGCIPADRNKKLIMA